MQDLMETCYSCVNISRYICKADNSKPWLIRRTAQVKYLDPYSPMVPFHFTLWFRPRLCFHSPLRRQTTLKFAGDIVLHSTAFNGLIIYLHVKSLSNSVLIWLLRDTSHCNHLNNSYSSMVLLVVRVLWLSGSLSLLKAWQLYKGSLTNSP